MLTHSFKVSKLSVPSNEGNLLPALSSNQETLVEKTKNHGHHPRHNQTSSSIHGVVVCVEALSYTAIYVYKSYE